MTHTMTHKDNVNSPSHYNHRGVECIDAIEASMTTEQFIGYLKGNVIKYLWRFEYKNGLEDIKKAGWYRNKLESKYEEKAAKVSKRQEGSASHRKATKRK